MPKFIYQSILGLFLLGLTFPGRSQDTLAFQGFEGNSNDNWSITSGNNNSSDVGSSDTPSNQRIKSGSSSHLTNNATETLILSGFSNSTHTSRYIEIWTSSTAGTSGNGADGSDYIKVFVNNSNSFSSTPDIEIDGNSNVRYGMDGTGVMEITAGADSTYAYPSGGTKSGSDALAKIKINIIDAWTEVHLKIETKNNSSNEFWNIDDIRLVGTHSCTAPSTAASSFGSSSISSTGMTISWTRGNGDSVIVLGQATHAIEIDPVDGVDYAADADITGSGTSIAGAKVLYKGIGTSVAVSGLTAGTTYYYGIYEHNGTGPCYTNAQLNGSAATTCSTPTNISTLDNTEKFKEVDFSWSLPSCYDEVLLVAKSTSTISGTPSGDGSAYTANASFTGGGTAFDGGVVVYKGTGTSVTVTDLSESTTYYFRMYTRKGTSWSSGTEVSIAMDYVPRILISEVIDPSNLTTGRFGELFNADTFAVDFSSVTFYFCRQTNGGTMTCKQLTGTLNPGNTYVIANNSSTYSSTYSATADDTWGNTSGNGDDGYFLYYNGDNSSGVMMDAMGVLDQDGTSQSWEYTDSKAVRDTNISEPSATFTAADWTISGASTSDAEAGFHYASYPQAEYTDNVTVPAGHYGTLNLNGSGKTFTAGGDITVHNKLKLNNGVFDLNSNTLSLGNIVFDCTVSDASSTSYIYGGTVRYYVNSSTGTYDFDMGTASGNGLTPANITFTSATLATTAYLTATVTNSKHPNMDAGVTTYINRYWTIESTGITSPTYSIELIYNDADINGTESDLFPVKYGSTWERPTNSTSSITDTMGQGSITVGTNTLTWTGVRSFSIFGGAGNGHPLPVELVHFKAIPMEKGNRLNWSTASEIHSSHFDVEYSSDGKHFETIGSLHSTGYSNELRHYEYLDNRQDALCYYRLKAVDMDGSFEYSDVVQINRNKPSSAEDNLQAYFTQGQTFLQSDQALLGTIQITTMDGKILFGQLVDSPAGTVQLDTPLDAGVYILLMYDARGKLIKRQKLEAF